MFLFLYGDDTFRSREKLEAIKGKYLDAAMSDVNLLILDGKKTPIGEIIRQCQVLPFLANKRLVILKNFLLEAKKEIQEKMVAFLDNLSDSTVLVFYEEAAPDKRLVLFRKLNVKNKAEEFTPLSREKLNIWIENRVASYEGQIDKNVVETLGEYIGSNLWRMDNEIKKLLTFKSSISREDVTNLVRPEISANIFETIDFLGQKNKRRALQSVYNLLEEGENELYILTMIIYQFRNLILVKKMAEKNSNQYYLAKTLSLHPFVVSKALLGQKYFSFVQLKKIYRTLLDFDWRIKVGKIEPRTALDLLVMKITQA